MSAFTFSTAVACAQMASWAASYSARASTARRRSSVALAARRRPRPWRGRAGSPRSPRGRGGPGLLRMRGRAGSLQSPRGRGGPAAREDAGASREPAESARTRRPGGVRGMQIGRRIDNRAGRAQRAIRRGDRLGGAPGEWIDGAESVDRRSAMDAEADRNRVIPCKNMRILIVFHLNVHWYINRPPHMRTCH
jgi:hypothetical protein